MAGNVAYAYSWLVQNGFRPNAAAGIIGNLMQESGVNPRSNQAGGPGMGICQWSEGARWDSLLQWANQHGKNEFDLDTQLEFMVHEMKAYGILNKMKGMVNIASATRFFMDVFERPDPAYANFQGRLNFAQNVRERDPSVATEAGKGGNGGKDGKGGKGGDDGKGGKDPTKGEYGFSHEFLDKHPEIKRLVDKADKEDWTVERFQAELKETRWYRKLTDAQQQWTVLSAEKPAQAKQVVADKRNEIEQAAMKMGVHLSDKEIDDLALRAARNGLDAEDMLRIIGKQFEIKKGDDTQTGQAAITIDQIRNYAEEFGVKVDRATMERWTSQILSGYQTVEGLVDRLREQAKLGVGDEVKAMLDNGQTMRDVLEPYMNQAAEELGIPTSQMRTADSLWQAALGNKKEGPMSLEEWTAKVRTDKSYGWDKTEKAQQQAASLASEFGKLFGAVG